MPQKFLYDIQTQKVRVNLKTMYPFLTMMCELVSIYEFIIIFLDQAT